MTEVEPQCLAVKAGEEERPAAMWGHDNESWTLVAASLDGFVKKNLVE